MFENLSVPKSLETIQEYLRSVNSNKFKIKQTAQALHVELIITDFFFLILNQ